MEYDFPKSMFYKTFMTAVFVGIGATLIAILYDVLFVSFFSFPLSAIINVSSLIFGVNIIFLLIGAIYYICVASSKKGELLYIILFAILTAFLGWRSEHVNRTEDPIINHEFRNLLTGIVLIVGVMAAFLVPYLYHNKKFQDNVI